MSVANVLMDYASRMKSTASGLADSFDKGQQSGRRNALAQQQTEIEKQKVDVAKQKLEAERAHEQAKGLAGIAAWADTPEKWGQAQSSGYLPKELTYESREPFIMGVLTEDERLNREKHKYQKEKDSKSMALDERKARETERHNRASERNAAAKGAGGDGGSRPKIAEENAIYKLVAQQFDAQYNPITGGFMGFSDDRSKQQAQKIATDAARLYQANPNMTALMAVSEALQRNNININQFSSGNGQQIPAGGQTPNAQFQYIPGRGLVPMQ